MGAEQNYLPLSTEDRRKALSLSSMSQAKAANFMQALDSLQKLYKNAECLSTAPVHLNIDTQKPRLIKVLTLSKHV